MLRRPLADQDLFYAFTCLRCRRPRHERRGRGRHRIYCAPCAELAYDENARALKHERGGLVFKPCLPWVGCGVCGQTMRAGMPARRAA